MLWSVCRVPFTKQKLNMPVVYSQRNGGGIATTSKGMQAYKHTWRHACIHTMMHARVRMCFIYKEMVGRIVTNSNGMQEYKQAWRHAYIHIMRHTRVYLVSKLVFYAQSLGYIHVQTENKTEGHSQRDSGNKDGRGRRKDTDREVWVCAKGVEVFGTGWTVWHWQRLSYVPEELRCLAEVELCDTDTVTERLRCVPVKWRYFARGWTVRHCQRDWAVCQRSWGVWQRLNCVTLTERLRCVSEVEVHAREVGVCARMVEECVREVELGASCGPNPAHLRYIPHPKMWHSWAIIYSKSNCSIYSIALQ